MEAKGRGMWEGSKGGEAGERPFAEKDTFAKAFDEVETCESRQIEWFHPTCTSVDGGEETRERRGVNRWGVWVVGEFGACAKRVSLFFFSV